MLKFLFIFLSTAFLQTFRFLVLHWLKTHSCLWKEIPKASVVWQHVKASTAFPSESGDYFARREFAFILDEDVHLRYRCFADQAEFEQELCKINPHKLDIGAVYSHKVLCHFQLSWSFYRELLPSFITLIGRSPYDDDAVFQPKENKKHSDFKALERELVFDIDLTDYDNVRKCCS